MIKRRHKYIFRAAIVSVLLVACSWKLWLPGWTITRLAEWGAQKRLGLETRIGLFQNESDGSYSLSDLQICNDSTLPGTLMLDCDYIFLTPAQSNTATVNFQEVQCCNGDVYIYMLPDGRTNLDSLKVGIPRHVQLSNIRIRFTTPGGHRNQELVMMINGQVSFDADGMITESDLKVTRTNGSLLTRVLKSDKDTALEGLSLTNLLTSPDAALILYYAPAYASLQKMFFPNK